MLLLSKFNEYKEMIECESGLMVFRVAIFHILIPLSMFANFHLRGRVWGQ